MDALDQRLDAALMWARDGRHATSTRDLYDRAWREFADWCRRGDRAALPSSPETIVAYCGWLRLGRPSADGVPRKKPLKASTIDLHVCAVVDQHVAHSLPSPRTAEVTALLRAMRHEDGAPPPLRDALSLPSVRGVVSTPPTSRVAGVRDRFVLLVGYHGELDLHLLAALTPGDLQVTAQGLSVRLPDGRTRAIKANDDDRLCPRRAAAELIALLPASASHVLGVRAVQGRPTVARAAPVPIYVSLHNQLALRARAAGINSYRSFPHVGAGLDVSDVRRIWSRLDPAYRLFVRDRAYLLLGLHAGMRAGEPAQLRWTDLTHVRDRGLVVRISSTKEQGARPRDVYIPIPYASDPELCAVEAVAEWRGLCERPEGPLFPSSSTGVALSRSGQASLFRRLLADVEGNVGGHSMRTTFVTEALAAGHLPLDVAGKTRHSTWTALSRYHRPDEQTRTRAAMEVTRGLGGQQP
jgi:hypothetical protein